MKKSELGGAQEAAKYVLDAYPRDEIDNSGYMIVEYYHALVEFCENGGITRRQACILIADTMPYPVVRKNWDIESIVINAGSIYLPNSNFDITQDEQWEFMRIWLAEKSISY